MPLYEYKCLQCHRHTEKIQKFSDTEITICPHCGGTLKRVISAPAIAFKGGGWYADGYGNAKPSASAESSATETKVGETKTSQGEGKADSKATPAEGKSSGGAESSATPAPAAPAPAAPAASSSDKK